MHTLVHNASMAHFWDKLSSVQMNGSYVIMGQTIKMTEMEDLE